MKFYRQHIINTIFTILFVASFLAPSVLKINHALTDHEELVCHSEGKTHLHKVELDCDFEKYKVTIQFQPPSTLVAPLFLSSVKKEYTNQYTFLSKYQKLHFALRGPPFASI